MRSIAETYCGWIARFTLYLRRIPSREIAILTQHSPTRHQMAGEPENVVSPLWPGFSTELSGDWQSRTLKLWAFGHTYLNCDYEGLVTGKRILTNQHGYHYMTSKGFDG